MNAGWQQRCAHRVGKGEVDVEADEQDDDGADEKVDGEYADVVRVYDNSTKLSLLLSFDTYNIEMQFFRRLQIGFPMTKQRERTFPRGTDVVTHGAYHERVHVSIGEVRDDAGDAGQVQSDKSYRQMHPLKEPMRIHRWALPPMTTMFRMVTQRKTPEATK